MRIHLGAPVPWNMLDDRRDAAIEQAIAGDETDELVLLRQLVAKKRQQTKYRDDNLKLMQYLARQGFNYSDIKAVLESVDE